MHIEWTDFGEEMSRVQGAVVITRPDLAVNIGPADHLDFVKVFQSYFTIFKTSLFPIRYGPRRHSKHNPILTIIELYRSLSPPNVDVARCLSERQQRFPKLC